MLCGRKVKVRTQGQQVNLSSSVGNHPCYSKPPSRLAPGCCCENPQVGREALPAEDATHQLPGLPPATLRTREIPLAQAPRFPLSRTPWWVGWVPVAISPPLVPRSHPQQTSCSTGKLDHKPTSLLEGSPEMGRDAGSPLPCSVCQGLGAYWAESPAGSTNLRSYHAS